MISQLNSQTKPGLKGRKQCRHLDDRRVAFAVKIAKARQYEAVQNQLKAQTI